MISGATGALAVVMISLVSEHGVQYLFATWCLWVYFRYLPVFLSWENLLGWFLNQ